MNRRELTPRERTVVTLVGQGLTNPQIANNLGLSTSTVRQNLANVLIKWDCVNRTQIAVESARRDLDRLTGQGRDALPPT